MKKIIIKLSLPEAILISLAIVLTASAIKKHFTQKSNNTGDFPEAGIAAVSDAIFDSPAAEYVFGENRHGDEAV